MRKNYGSLFSSSTTPSFDMSSMYDFANPKPVDPFTSLGRFSLAPKNILQDDANYIADQESEPAFSATKALIDYVNNVPKKEDYKLSKMGTFAAALAGAAAGFQNPAMGVETALQMKERPYRNALAEYQSKLPGLELSANLEAQAAGNDIKYQQLFQNALKDQGDLKNKNRELDIKQGELNETINKNKQDFENNKNKYIAEGWKPFTDDQGIEWIINPLLPEGQNRKQIGKGIKDREVKVSESNARANNIQAGAAVTSANAAASNAATNKDRLNNVDIPNSKSNIGRDTKLNELTDNQIATSGQIDPQEQLYAQALAAREVVQENPGWAKYLNEDGSLNYNEINNSGGWFGHSAEDITDFLNHVKLKLETDRNLPVLERKYKRPVTQLGRSLTIPPGN